MIRCILLKDGRIEVMGETKKVIGEYLNRTKKFIPLKNRKDRTGNGILRFTDIKIETPYHTDYLITGKPFTVKLYFDINKNYETLKNVAISLTINDQISGNHLLAFWTETSGSNFLINKNVKCIECDISKCHLVYGQYYINIYCTIDGIISDYVINVAKIAIDDTEYFNRGTRDHESHPKYIVDHKWKLI